jgi:peptide/nickel transport system substrate-binding protein
MKASLQAGWRRLALLVGLVLVAVACGDSKGATSTGTDSAAADQPQRGGTLVYLHTLEPPSLDPMTSTGAGTSSGDTQQMSAVFDLLLYEDATSGEVKPQIFESFTSPDAVTWTFKLRPNVKFSDGTAYDAAAVKFNWDRIGDLANKAPSLAIVQAIQALEVVDPLTLKVTLKAANSQFPRLVARRIPFAGSPTAIRAKGAQFASEPVGAGPFTVKSWVRGGDLTLVRNASYWDAPRPYVDELIIRVIADATQRYNTFATGAASMAVLHTAVRLADKAKSDHLSFDMKTVGGGTYFILNSAKAPFNDIRARKAVALGMDRDKLNTTLYAGGAPAQKTMLPQGSPFYDASLTLPTYDPAAAQKLFDAIAADNGGRPMEFTIGVSTNTKDVGEFFQAQFSQFKNVTVKLDVFSPAEGFGKAQSGNFQATSFGAGYIDPDPELFDIYSTGASRNFNKYTNAEMDRALAAGRSSLNTKDRAASYKTVQRLAIDNVGEVWFQGQVKYFLYKSNLQGRDYAGEGIPLWSHLWFKS